MRLNFKVRHPRCVSNKSNYKAYAYIVKHNYVLGGMVFTIQGDSGGICNTLGNGNML